jgi:CRP-like cAMP-binding protein
VPKDLKLQHLARVSLFTTLNTKELARVSRATDEVMVAAGTVLVRQGASGHEFYLILDGRAVVRRGERQVDLLGPGQYFGELSLLDRAPRNATVIADTSMTLLVLGQREFSAVLDEVPGVAHKMLRTMAHRLRLADERATSH